MKGCRLAHWHVWCAYCRRVKVFRGPCCEACYREARDLVADLFE